MAKGRTPDPGALPLDNAMRVERPRHAAAAAGMVPFKYGPHHRGQRLQRCIVVEACITQKVPSQACGSP